MALSVVLTAQDDPRMSPPKNKVRPITAPDKVFMEEMTWMEVRDALKAGKTTAIVATGGLEMNGPYLVTGKHNIVCRVLSEKLAKSLGNALVATIVPYVPEGDLDKVDGHLRYPGTISVRPEIFTALLTDIAKSLKVTGFKNIILIGDSGSNTDGMQQVTDQLSKEWGDQAGIYHVAEFFDNPKWDKWLAEKKGIKEVSEGIHDSFRYTTMMMLADPEYVRAKERMEKDLFTINGVSLAPIKETLKIAEELADYQIKVTADAINKRMK